MLEVAAAFHGFEHGDFVGVFEVGANGDADTDAGDADAEGLEELGEVDGGGFAFGGGIGGDDDFLDVAAPEAVDELLDFELLGAAALEGGERAAEDLVHAAVGAGFFDGENIVRFLDYADGGLVAVGSRAIETGIGVGDVGADRALADFFLGVANGVGQGESILGSAAQEMESEALGRFLANSGKMLQFIDETFNRTGKIGHVFV